MDDRGVSDVLAFVFVFSLIVLTTGTVVVFGFSGLEDARDAEQVSNAERAFDVLAENVDDIAIRDAPGRGTELRLSGSRLGFGSPTDIAVLATPRGSNRSKLVEEVTTDTLTYTAGDSRLVYEGTGVFRTEQGGSATVREPTLVATRDHTLVTLVRVEGTGPTRGGSGVVLVRTERTDRSSSVVRNVSTVTIRVETDPRRVGAWERTLEEKTPGDDSCGAVDRSRGIVECSYETETVAVTETTVAVSYED